MFNRNNAFNFPHSSHPRNEFHDMLLAAVANQELCGESSAAAAAAAKASKKDRHSKIDTAQGPRDRRVRLSIGVARKFFDLQENLGFDKPSKTLDWLLTKSETAIQDLEVMKERDAAAAGAGSSECEVDSGENGADLKHNSVKAAAKESRAKARARARERTREKMCIKKFNETRNSINTASDFNPIQFMNNQLDFRKIASSSSNINLGFHCHPTAYEVAAANSQDLIQESIVIKRKVKNPMIFQQNLIISSSNYGVPAPYNVAAAENWDNICAILDQHKFISSTSNN